MPIKLDPYEHSSRGPDGQGWNRLRVEALPGADQTQCALRPKFGSKIFESQDTRRAKFGGFAPCDHPDLKSCTGCPRLTKRTYLEAFAPEILFRENPDKPGKAYVMNHPSRGWSSSCFEWPLEDVAALVGWEFSRLHSDECSQGFWMKWAGKNCNGIYGVVTC